ncbi:MAG: hypothetical protein ABR531_04595, partial [Bacteroidales bacterium]
VKVNADPRMAAPDTDALIRNLERAGAFGARISELNEKLKIISIVRESLAKSEELISRDPGFAETMSGIHKTVKEDLTKLDEAFGRRPDGLSSRISGCRSLLMASGVPSQQEEKGMTDAEPAIQEAEEMINEFLGGSWASYTDALKKITLTGDAVILR